MTVNEQCIICLTETNVKYKCPKCFLRYCSIACCRQHKENGCEPVEVAKKEEPPKYEYPTPDTVPVEKLEALRHSAKLKEILSNPHLRHIINAIDKSDRPSTLIHSAMLEPIFVEFADECLRLVQDPEEQET